MSKKAEAKGTAAYAASKSARTPAEHKAAGALHAEAADAKRESNAANPNTGPRDDDGSHHDDVRTHERQAGEHAEMAKAGDHGPSPAQHYIATGESKSVAQLREKSGGKGAGEAKGGDAKGGGGGDERNRDENGRFA
jgi:hypothetical protein